MYNYCKNNKLRYNCSKYYSLPKLRAFLIIFSLHTAAETLEYIETSLIVFLMYFLLLSLYSRAVRAFSNVFIFVKSNVVSSSLLKALRAISLSVLLSLLYHSIAFSRVTVIFLSILFIFK